MSEIYFFRFAVINLSLAVKVSIAKIKMIFFWQGYIVLFLILYITVLKPRTIVLLSIFLVPFSATVVLKTANGFPVSPFLLAFPFSILHLITNRNQSPTDLGLKSQLGNILPLVAFGLVIFFSTFMPLIIDGNLWVTNSRKNSEFFTRVEFQMQNLKNPLPTIINIAFAVALSLYTRSEKQLFLFAKTYVLSGMCVAFWGGVQFLCGQFGYEYPYQIFNNSDVESMQGYLQMMDLDIGAVSRVCSVMHEPAILVKYLWCVLVLLFVNRAAGSYIVGRRIDVFIILLIVSVILISTSSTGYLGFAFFLVIQTALKFCSKDVKIPFGISSFVGLLLLSAILIAGSTGKSVWNATILEKLESGSAEERFYSVETSFEYFLVYPIMGIGWGVVTCHDLFVFLLVGTGLVGLATFLVLNYQVAKSVFLLRRSRTGVDRLSAFAIAGLSAVAIAVLNGAVSGLDFYVPNYFTIISLTIASTQIGLTRVLGQEVKPN